MSKRRTGVVAVQSRTAALKAEDVDITQYQIALKLLAAGQSEGQIKVAARLTHQQLQWVLHVGNEDMPALAPLVLEQLAEIRNRARESGVEVGRAGVEALRVAIKVNTVAGTLVQVTLAEIGQIFKRARDSGVSVDIPKSLTEFLRAVQPYADYAKVAHAYRAVFDGGTGDDPVSRLPRGSAGEYAPDLTPAILTSMGGVDRQSSDDLTWLGADDWSDDEVRDFIASGRIPDSKHADPGRTPQGADDGSPPDDGGGSED